MSVKIIRQYGYFRTTVWIYSESPVDGNTSDDPQEETYTRNVYGFFLGVWIWLRYSAPTCHPDLQMGISIPRTCSTGDPATRWIPIWQKSRRIPAGRAQLQMQSRTSRAKHNTKWDLEEECLLAWLSHVRQRLKDNKRILHRFNMLKRGQRQEHAPALQLCSVKRWQPSWPCCSEFIYNRTPVQLIQPD